MEERKHQVKCVKAALLIVGSCYVIGNWIATQNVADSCNYNEVLGGIVLGEFHLYPPYGYFIWSHDEWIQNAIPHILAQNHKYITFAVLIGIALTYLYLKSSKQHTTHGSARFASKQEIDEAGLSSYIFKDKKVKLWGKLIFTRKVKEMKQSGVVIGINPYTHKLMLHDGPEHILLMAPTRSGKGVNTIIPTGLIWKDSMFFFDVKGELWQATAGYRQKELGQKVIKFEPLCVDGSSARWNPLAEINFMTNEELADTSTIVNIMVRPNGEKAGSGDPFWDNAAAALINGIILHLLYSHYREKKPLPCPTDIMSFLSSPDKTTDELFEEMKNYAHITPEEFFEQEYKDEAGRIRKRKNPLKEIYGEYIRDLQVFSKELGCPVRNLDDIRVAMLESCMAIDFEDEPYCMLLTHPKIAECANNMLQGAEQTRASIMQSAQTALALYQDPVIQKNTAVSDFCIRDLLDPKQAVSLYLVLQFKDMKVLKPLSRLFINTILDKLIRDMKFEKEQTAKKRKLLLMLDEFPQLGNLEAMERALAVCAGYGIKICIVSQDVNQLNKEYTKDNSLASNCHVHIYFTPNLDSGSATAAAISKNLGKKTIVTTSHSDGGGLFKGSNTVSHTARELMTADEVSHMSSEKILVFVAGHNPIFGDKLRYYLKPIFMKRILKPPIFSDVTTKISDFKELFAVHALEAADKEAKKERVAAAKLLSQEKERSQQAYAKTEDERDEKTPLSCAPAVLSGSLIEKEGAESARPQEAEACSEDKPAAAKLSAQSSDEGQDQDEINRKCLLKMRETEDSTKVASNETETPEAFLRRAAFGELEEIAEEDFYED